MSQEPPIDFRALDGRTPGRDGQPDVYIPGGFWPKLFFVIFSATMTLVGIWALWDPGIRYFTGERAEARVTRIVRTEPGMPDQVIRVRREFEEQGHTVDFIHYVEIIDAEGRPHDLMMGVNSQNQPYAQFNDLFEVVYFPGENVAFGLFHHRTWAFGAALTSIGGTLLMVSVYILWFVGKPIEIDPENEEDLAEERHKLAEDQRRLAEL